MASSLSLEEKFTQREEERHNDTHRFSGAENDVASCI